MNLRDALAGGGALLTGLAFLLGAVTERTVAPVDNAYDVVVPASPQSDEMLRVCRTQETAFERTDNPLEGQADLITARLVEQASTTYLTWADGGPVAIVEVVQTGDDLTATEPVSPEFADCMRSRAPTVAKEPFR